ncbi:hypothetical protein ALP17_200026 [Pseudomonas savastanoi]|uniref:Uncharacterized protein n=1 Tax=Pseudomonas savastanoi TaxID=29438 RepID=A0A3M6A0T7_PSESS|nr:hypothetical protein ALP17_200026 [Pseudomonas savastanoi]
MIAVRGHFDCRSLHLYIEALTCVFHQGPSDQLNMTVCSTAVLHLLTSIRHMQRSQTETIGLVLNGEALVRSFPNPAGSPLTTQVWGTKVFCSAHWRRTCAEGI